MSFCNSVKFQTGLASAKPTVVIISSSCQSFSVVSDAKYVEEKMKLVEEIPDCWCAYIYAG